MWSKIVLCLVVGLVAASDYAWKQNTEYIYKISGHTLSSFSDSDAYNGILLRGKLVVRPQGEGVLTAKLRDIEYAEIFSDLPGGYDTYIEEDRYSYKKMELTAEPFQILTQNGAIVDLVVDDDVTNWQANIIKSIVTQLQLDVNGANVMKSRLNQLPEQGENNGIFKTMEETVTGKLETLYELNPLPMYMLQSEPELVPLPELVADNNEVIEVIKHKNFSRAEILPSYHYGFAGMGDFEPSTSQMEEFMSRSSMSRAVITGKLERHVIQSTMTVNKIAVSPTLDNDEKAMVVSVLNLTLAEVKSSSSPFPKPSQPQQLGSLVYEYDNAFDEDNKVSENKRKPHTAYSSDSSSSSSSSSDESDEVQHSKYQSNAYQRLRRSVGDSSSSSSSSSSSEEEEDEDKYQKQPQLNSPPEVPFLPYYVGNNGQSIKKHNKIDIVQEVRQLTQEIAEELQNPQDIPEQQTLAKYSILVKVCRIMNEEEMQQVANQLYEEQAGLKRDAYKIYRDVLAESGTAPALLTLQRLIVAGKLKHEEAAEVIAAFMESVREPTQQLMKLLFDLSKSEAIENQYLLNDTLIVSYANLVHKVYVNKEHSKLEFPIHVFGSFNTQEGRDFVERIYIPYLSKQLDVSIQEGDSHKVLVYIRALGNTGHRQILKCFKPYWEGSRQASQFQRLQMVIALDKLVEAKPEVARSVLYKIYQNTAENEDIRTAAVYLFIRADPLSSMLQRMAEYTNFDSDDYVNAAVKSVIEAAAELEGEEYSDLASKAKAALPLLTPQEYGMQYSHVHLRSTILNELNAIYNMESYLFGSDDSDYPQGIQHVWESSLNGLKRKMFVVNALVSSVDELTNIVAQQFQETRMHQQEKASAMSSEKNQYSSKQIIDKLQMQFDQREQLEGALLLSLGESERYFSFNNQTLNLAPKLVQHLEGALRSGLKINYNKLTTSEEIILSFPTEMGFAFVYEHRKASLLKASGEVKMLADPRISDGQQLQVPNKIKASAQVRLAWSRKVESSVSIVHPQEHKQYLAGYEKDVQVYVPLKYSIEIDVKNQELTKEFEFIESKDNIDILQYSSYPYMAQYDIISLKPVSESKNYYIVRDEDDVRGMELSLGKEETGMSFRFEIESEELPSRYYLHQLLHSHDILSDLWSPLSDKNLPYTSFNLTYEGEQSSTYKVQIHSKCLDEEYSEEERPEKNINFDQLSQQLKQRLEEIANVAVSKISSAEVLAGEMQVKFTGNQQIEYTLGGAWASSPVDKKSRVLFHAERSSSSSTPKPYIVTLDSRGSTPNTNGLNYQFAKNINPIVTNDIRIQIGEKYSDATEFDLKVKLSKSQERQRYLDETPEVQQCLRDMQEGNTQLPLCANVTAEANLLDKISMQLKYKKVNAETQDLIYSSYHVMSHLLYAYVDENELDIEEEEGELKIEAQFEPDFSALNVSINSDKFDIDILQVPIDGWTKQVMVIHPVFSVRDRVIGELQKNQVYYPFCTVDQTAISTFDNKTYPAVLPSTWSVLFHYVPDYAKYLEVDEDEQREQLQYEEHVILAQGAQQKEIKLTVRAAETSSKLVEINLKPSQAGQLPKVYAEGKELRYSETKAVHLEENYIKIYALPNQEVKVQVGDDYYVIYDGYRAKITATDDKFVGALRGLCGTYTGDDSTDFTAPQNCILRDPEDFVYSYTLNPKQSRKISDKCEPQQYNYVSVVSRSDLGIKDRSYSGSRQDEQSSGSCTKHQTQYQEDGSQVCFTVHPLPLCKSSCRASDKIRKQVKVHCVEKSNVAELWMKQIDKGANPDFSLKAPHKTIAFQVPQKCVQ